MAEQTETTASTDEALAQAVIDIIAEQSLNDQQQVTLASTPQDLGIDSLGLVEIVFAIEERFDISVPFNANDPGASDFDISTVGSVVDAVKRLVAEQGAA